MEERSHARAGSRRLREVKGERSSPDVDASSVGNRVVLYHRTSRKAVVLNPTGSYLWEELASPKTAEELSAALTRRFPAVDAEAARRDVDAFLAELAREGLLATEPA
jgi:hypothetical protein